MSNRNFDLIPSRTDALGFLNEAAKTLANVNLWTKGGERNFNSIIHMVSEAEGVLYINTPADFNQMQFVEDLVKAGSRDCFFSASLVNANILFKAAFVGYDHGMKFKLPDEVYKAQRRQNMRLMLNETQVSIIVKFKDPLLGEIVSKPALDISAGGLAIRVDELEASVYQAPLILDDVSFDIRSKTIKCKAEVRHQSPIKAPDGRVTGTKIGLLFLGLPTIDGQIITTFVIEESRKIITDFLG